MNNQLTEIAFILDRSGSMASVTEAAISAFNDFLQEHQQADGHARLTLVLFDDEYTVPIDAIPVGEAVPLDSSTYTPRGSTALLDAIGETIHRIGARLATTAEAERPGQVIVAIMTDGFENSSERFTWQAVAKLIREQTKAYNWQFLFLGANQDAIATAASLSIDKVNAATYVADGIGTRSTGRALGRKSSAVRRQSAGYRLTIEEQAALQSPLSEVVKEEDAKRRKDE